MQSVWIAAVGTNSALCSFPHRVSILNLSHFWTTRFAPKIRKIRGGAVQTFTLLDRATPPFRDHASVCGGSGLNQRMILGGQGRNRFGILHGPYQVIRDAFDPMNRTGQRPDDGTERVDVSTQTNG